MKLFFFQHLVWQAVATTSGWTQDEELNAVQWGQYNATDNFDGIIRDVGGGRMDALLIPPFESNHASMVEQTADGRIHMAWFSGTGEGQSNVAIVYTHVNDANTKFTKAEVISQRSGYSNQNAVLYAQDSNSKLHVFHSQQKAGKGESAATVWHLSGPIDADGKVKSFTDPTEVFTKPGSFCKNRVVELLDGSWMVPIYGQDKSPNYPKNEFMNNKGHWNRADEYTIGKYGSGCDDRVQPTVIRLKEGQPKLVAFFRDRKAKNIYRSASHDDGKTWDPCKVNVLPNNDAGIHAWQMRSGRIAMIYNPQTQGRTKMAISLSEDGGVSWPYTRIIEEESQGANGADFFSYPTLREDRFEDGKMHISYTWLRKTIKYSMVLESWVMKGSEEIVV